MKKRLVAVITLCVALCASLALAGCSSSSSDVDTDSLGLMTEGTLTVASSPDYPPFENLDGDEPVGFEVDLWNAVADYLGLQTEFVSMQFDAIIPAIVAGGQADVGVSGFSVTPERAEEITFTNSYYTDDQGVAVMSGGEITEDNQEDLLNQSGVVIAAQSGTTGESYAQENYPEATVKGYGSSNDCFAALQSGQADAVITNLAVVNSMLADAYSDAEVVAQVATGEEYAMVVSQDNPTLVDALNEAIQALTDDGTIDSLLSDWF